MESPSLTDSAIQVFDLFLDLLPTISSCDKASVRDRPFF